jgi:hypothetical protein
MGKIPPTYYNDLWRWPHCYCCGREPSYDHLWCVGSDNVCYACFDLVRFHVAEMIRETLPRLLLDTFLPRDVRLHIHGLLYRLMLQAV